MKQQRAALLKEKETADKVASRAFAQSYLSDLVPSVFSTLSQNGFFYDPVERGTVLPAFNFLCSNFVHLATQRWRAFSCPGSSMKQRRFWMRRYWHAHCLMVSEHTITTLPGMESFISH